MSDELFAKKRAGINCEEDFWERVDVRGPKKCWIWKMSVDNNGYGRFSIWRDGKQRQYRSHRFVAILKWGEAAIAAPAVVMHECDNPPCCNPAHLRVGNVRENTRDMFVKGRAKYGTRRP